MILIAAQFAAVFVIGTLVTTVLASLIAGYLDQRREQQQGQADEITGLTPEQLALLISEQGGTYGWICTCGTIGHGFLSARTALAERRVHRAHCPSASIRHYDARRPR